MHAYTYFNVFTRKKSYKLVKKILTKKNIKIIIRFIHESPESKIKRSKMIEFCDIKTFNSFGFGVVVCKFS